MIGRARDGEDRRRRRGAPDPDAAPLAIDRVARAVDPVAIPAGFVRVAADAADDAQDAVELRYQADPAAFVTTHPRTQGLLAPAGDPIELRVRGDAHGGVRAEVDMWELEDLLAAVRSGPGSAPRRRARPGTATRRPGRPLEDVVELLDRFLRTAAHPG